MKQHYPQSYDQSCETALSWIARLRVDEVSAQDQQSFALWLAEDSSHKVAMDAMLDMWDDLGTVREMPFPLQITEPASNQRNWFAASAAVAP